ncbi:MAG: hypothetical protein VB876_08520, partial [Pirellulales bacterium]
MTRFALTMVVVFLLDGGAMVAKDKTQDSAVENAIEAVGEEIKRKPDDPGLLARRGDLYASIRR